MQYYLSKGFDEKTAAYYAAGRRRILSVKANDDFSLTMEFDNGECRVLDCTPFLSDSENTVFAPLCLYENFRRVYLDDEHCVAWDIDPTVDSNIVWSNKIDISPDTCYLDSTPLV
ncbi:MAG: DUF2442 domain-containing protein [Clostridia bacterium]|nr:DUF2442 domain-containing protein [Clostridia bacterium]